MQQEDISVYKWYAIRIRSRHEFKVIDRLSGAKIEAFLPAVERLSKWKDRKKLVAFPLFPGYLFVHIDKDSEKKIIVLKTQGVVRFVGHIAGEPEPVPDDQIISLKKLIENKHELNPYPYLKEGQKVRIRKGPLAGVEGILVSKPEQHILVLSVDILRQGVSIKIDASDVETI